MAARKFAISIPEDVMSQVDLAAAERGLTRSGFIALVLSRTARARSDAAISRRIDEVLADPNVAAEQRRTAAAFGSRSPVAGRDAERW
ncbi:MAG: hypothetical protein HY744_12680 [Deltaproteobacteria bacterium]|nr:hypothetical protein [Deltaproteobacteria bacterium]